ncbi:MAG TPA: site-specific DNA-methyltransferase [Bacilli bacterium]|nr:site-specific DNA-methyltransferase [Bacilli bacterium]
MAEKLEMMSSDIIKENIDYIAKKFPNALKEVIEEGKVVKKIDFDVLKQELSTVVIDDRQERYQMTWPDKKDSILLANRRISGTLRPIKEKSADFENTKNLYIEGDNLDVLKLLRETYLGKVKMIYIDPPYNTGNDFVYEDDFAQSSEDYLSNSGQFDNQGNRLVQNTDSNGRFHTDWLNMMYPRLKIAKDLLTDDGIIFMSIDHNEVSNLIKISDEIFGKNNLVAILSIENNPKGRKNGKFVSINNEFCLIYAKNYALAQKFENIIRKKDLSQDEFGYYTHGKRVLVGESTNKVLTNKSSDKNYTVYYNKKTNNLILQKNELGIFDNKLLNNGYVVFQSNNKKDLLENTYTESKFLDLHKENSLIFKDNSIYEKDRNVYSQQKTLINTTDEYDLKTESADFKIDNFSVKTIFNNPKNVNFIKMLIKMVAGNDFLVLDFFSGSGTAAHAVMNLNLEDNGTRKFIMVQLPEKTTEGSEAFKLGYKDICDIGEDRIKKAGNLIKKEAGILSDNMDVGFRVLKLDSSNMNDVYYNPNEIRQNLLDQLVGNIKEDRTPLDLLFQVMLELGIELSAKIEEKELLGKKYFVVNENDIVACFDDGISDSLVTELAKIKPIYAVFKDSSFESDSANINSEQIFKTISPSTSIKVI